jgi:hypothetical protein
VPEAPDTIYELDPSSFAFLSVDGGEGAELDVIGLLGSSGGDCPGESCAFALSYMTFDVQNFLVDSTSVSDPTAFLSASLNATVDEDGNFVIPEGGATLWARFTVEDIQGSQAEPFPGGFDGTYDFVGGTLALSGSVSFPIADDVNLDADLNFVANAINRPPVAVALVPPEVECDRTNAALVHLDGSGTTDPDGIGDLESTLWVENFRSDGATILAETLSADVELSLGPHTISLWVFDDEGAESVDTVVLEVVDTTPPLFTNIAADPECLWPPNHQFVEFRLGENLSFEVVEICDATPHVRIVAAASSEPDDFLGDGSTTNDVEAGSEAVCLRSERSGLGDGRTYSVGLRATDDSGNASDGAVDIPVPHDQRGGRRCRSGIDREVFLREPTLACTAEALAGRARSIVEQEPRPEARPALLGGCAAGGRDRAPVPSPTAAALLTLLLGRRSRRVGVRAEGGGRS